jgi:hypothetical protein
LICCTVHSVAPTLAQSVVASANVAEVTHGVSENTGSEDADRMGDTRSSTAVAAASIWARDVVSG